MAENKTQPGTGSAFEFIEQLPNLERRDEARALCALMMQATGEPPIMWGASIIGFGTYHYRYESGREGDAPAAGFSPRARELVVYLSAHSDRTDEMLDRLGKHKVGKSCLYIKRLSDIDQDVLSQIVQDSIREIRERHPDP